MGKIVTINESDLIKIKEDMVGSSNTASHNTVCVMEASPEVDEFELGQESDNPPLGGNYCHVNEVYSNVSVRGDMDKVDYIDYVPHDSAREEGYTADNITEFEPYYKLICYGINGDIIFSGELTLNELFDYFPDRIIHMMSNKEGRKVSQAEYRIEDILSWDCKPNNIDDVEEVNAIAKRIQPGGSSSYLLTDGDVVSFPDHIQITSIEGMSPSKFVGLGNIRVGVGGNGIELSKMPTQDQLYALRTILRGQNETYLDIVKDDGRMYPTCICSAAYKNANPNRVINDIIYYFEDGIRPQGTMAYESKRKYRKLIENISFEVNSSDIDLSSFKKKNNLAPIWHEDGILDSKIRMKLLDIADDFWKFVNLIWVKPNGIILTGSICNFNWSNYSDIDLHLIVDFDEIDEKTEFVRDYLDAKKNEWNNEHDGLKILDYPVELYVQNLGEMPQSGGIYDLEENDWIKKPNADDIKSIGLNKFSIKDKAANIMTIIDDMYDALNSTSDSHEIEEIGDDAKYLWKKVKNMRKKGLETQGESSSANIVYKILRRTNYLEKLWKLRTIVYDRSNSITESVDEMQAWHGTDAVFDKFDLAFLSKGEGSQEYGKGIYVTSSKSTGEHYVEIIRGVRMTTKGKEYMQKKWDASDDEKENAAQEYQNFLDNYDSIYDKLPGHLYKVDIPDDNGSNYFDYAAPMTPDEAKNIFIEFCKKGLIERGKYSDERYNRLVEKVNAAPYWNSIKSCRDFHLALYEEGMFERFSVILESLGYIGVKVPIGYLHGMKYGKGKNNMNYVIFDPKNVKIVSRKDMLTKKTTKFNESIKKYITLLKESVISEESVADGSSNGNPYEERWKTERKALKDFICNYGTLMQSKEDDKQGRLYKCFWDKTLSNLIGYNYCLAVQWDEIQNKPKSTIYVRACDRFTRNIRRNIQYDTRGYDNTRGTYDDLNYGNY